MAHAFPTEKALMNLGYSITCTGTKRAPLTGNYIIPPCRPPFTYTQYTLSHTFFAVVPTGLPPFIPNPFSTVVPKGLTPVLDNTQKPPGLVVLLGQPRKVTPTEHWFALVQHCGYNLKPHKRTQYLILHSACSLRLSLAKVWLRETSLLGVYHLRNAIEPLFTAALTHPQKFMVKQKPHPRMCEGVQLTWITFLQLYGLTPWWKLLSNKQRENGSYHSSSQNQCREKSKIS